MARIRTIKPDFFRHEALYEAECATKLPLRLAFAGLFTAADRDGRFPWRPRVLKLDVLPFDELDFEQVLMALRDHGFVVQYEVAGELFGHIPSWGKHQHVNQREADSVIPAPDIEGARICMHVQTRGEGKGREGKGKEGEGKENKVDLKVDGPVERVFEHWQAQHRHPDAKLTGDRRRIILRALKDYSEDQLRESIGGYRNSPHHMGQNERGTTYDGIELFLRDAKRIDAGLQFARAPPTAAKSAVELARENLLRSMGGGTNGSVVSEQSGYGEGYLGSPTRVLR
jgi:hypothetical protein